MKLEETKTWKIVETSFEKKYGYPINEHPASDLVKFLVRCIEKKRRRI